MYQLNLLSQASKLASPTARRPIDCAQQPDAEPHQHTSFLQLTLAKLANLATLRVMPGSPSGAAQHDPRDPRNW
jgi:hypothetical protein